MFVTCGSRGGRRIDAEVKLAGVRISTPVASLTLGGIPQNFSHLRGIALVRGDAAGTSTNFYLRFNGDTGTNYDFDQYQTNNGSIVNNHQVSNTIMDAGIMPIASATANRAAYIVFDIPFYTNKDFHKVVNATAGMSATGATSGMLARGPFMMWKNTSPVSSITLLPNSGNFVVGTRFDLYGIR